MKKLTIPVYYVKYTIAVCHLKFGLAVRHIKYTTAVRQITYTIAIDHVKHKIVESQIKYINYGCAWSAGMKKICVASHIATAENYYCYCKQRHIKLTIFTPDKT